MGINIEKTLGIKLGVVLGKARRERQQAEDEKYEEEINAWLLKNQAEYDGKFVALCDGQLVATGDTYAELIEEIIDDDDIENYTIKKVGRLVG